MPLDANAMSNKRNVVLYLDEDLVDKSKAPSFNLSRTFENHLKKLISQLSKSAKYPKSSNSQESGSSGGAARI